MEKFLKKFFKKAPSFLLALSILLTSTGLKNIKAAGSTVDIQILATSDMHGRFMPYSYALNEADLSGSMAQVASAVKVLRTQNANTILIDAGDTIQDNSSQLFFNDPIHPMIAGFNEMQYDVVVPGNHEFNYGVDVFENVYSKANMPTVVGNVYKNGTLIADNKGYEIVEKDGVKVGIIGMVSPNITKWDKVNMDGYTVTDAAVETKKIINQIKDQVDVLVAVEHMALNSEYGEPGSGAYDIADACPELDLIIAAHGHTAVGTAAKQEVRNGVKIVENKPYGQSVAKINIKVNDVNGKYDVVDKAADVSTDLVIIKGNYTPDPNFVTVVEPFDTRAKADAAQQIGTLTGGPLVPSSEIKGYYMGQLQDTAMIDLINKVQMEYTGADVSAAAAFSTNANIQPGVIKKSDTALIYKFDNTLYLLSMTGKQLKQYMEWSASYFNEFKPGDLTVTFNQSIPGYNYDMFDGVKYQVDISKPAGQRIVNLTKLDGTPVNETDTFKVSVNNYRANTQLLSYGPIFKTGEALPTVIDKDITPQSRPDLPTIRDQIGYYIQGVGGTITNDVNNNWSITGNNWDPSFRSLAVKALNDGTIPVDTFKAVTEADLKAALGIKGTTSIVAFNDFHGALVESGSNIGAAKLAAAIKSEQAKNPELVVLSAGDSYQGSATSNLLYGKPVTDILKYVNVKASAVGNHEFDWGLTHFAQWEKDGGFPFLAANIIDKTTGKIASFAKAYTVIESNGVKIGVIGLSTPETAFKTKPENVKNLEFTDPSIAAKEWATKLKDGSLPEGKVDVVIALTHLGSYQDASGKITGEAVDLANANTGIDAIIAGHTHATVNGVVNGIPIIEGYYNGRALGKLDIVSYNDGKVEVKPSMNLLYKSVKTLPVDEEAKKIVDKYVADIKPILDEVVGKTEVDLPHPREISAMGTWASELMKEAAKVEIAIQNGGGLRRGFDKGDITMGMMYELMPFDNTLVTMKLKGKDVKAALENGIGNDEIGWVQFAGIKIEYDLTRPFGDRITKMTLDNGKAVDLETYYTVVTNDFMYTGGDKYNFSAGIEALDTGVPIRDAIVEVLKARLKGEVKEEVKEENKQTVTEGNNNTPKPVTKEVAKAKLPQTGSPISAGFILLAGMILFIMGSVLLFRIKKNKVS